MGRTEENLDDIFEFCSDTMKLVHTVPQPTICAVQGLATAAGCQLVCSCDIVLASPRTVFQTPGINLGLFCHTPAVPLIRTVGQKVATDMLFTGRSITSQEALQYGLVSRVVGNPQKEASKLAHQLATQCSSTILQMGKDVLQQQESAGEIHEAYDIATRAMEDNIMMMDAIHGIESFLKNEMPQWDRR